MIDHHPVLTATHSMEWEKELLARDEKREWEAMCRAGRKVGTGMLEDYREIGPLPEGLRLLVLAGKGHNGGDALIAAREVKKRHPDAFLFVVFVFGAGNLRPLVRRAWEELQEESSRATLEWIGLEQNDSKDAGAQLEEKLGGTYWDFCLDGILGMQFRPPLRPALEGVLNWVNQRVSVGLRAAVDLPTGIGDESASLAFRSDFTYMTGIAKSPAFSVEAMEWVGRLRYLDIGFFDKEILSGVNRRIVRPAVLKPLCGLRSPLKHKRGYGHLFVLGGSRRMPGAILMAILAAAKSGAGLVTAFVPESLCSSFSARVPEVMWVPWPERADGSLAADGLELLLQRLEDATALLMGPGVGEGAEVKELLSRIANQANLPLLLDAQALGPEVMQGIARRQGEGWATVAATPHTGEFQRISGRSFSEAGEEGLLEFCRESGVQVLLKGPPFTRICDGSRVVYSLFGGPVLARGGSGDLLAGLIGGLMAQSPDDVEGAHCRGAAWHGLAAELMVRELGPTAVRTTDLLKFFPAALRTSQEGLSQTYLSPRTT